MSSGRLALEVLSATGSAIDSITGSVTVTDSWAVSVSFCSLLALLELAISSGKLSVVVLSATGAAIASITGVVTVTDSWAVSVSFCSLLAVLELAISSGRLSVIVLSADDCAIWALLIGASGKVSLFWWSEELAATGSTFGVALGAGA